LAQGIKKRPKPQIFGSGRVVFTNPWFHLNSHLADAHFVPGNGGAGGPFPVRGDRAPSPRGFEGLSPTALSLKPAARVLFSAKLCGYSTILNRSRQEPFCAIFSVFRNHFGQKDKNSKKCSKTP